MRFSRHPSLLALLLCGILAGCSLHPRAWQDRLPDTDVELRQTPFFPQQQYQCGPAALATVLQVSGIAVLPDDLTPRLYLPKRKGSLQLDLIGAIRSHQRIPYSITPDIGAVAAELKAGRPVLVLQNLGLKLFPAYHYAVVVGLQTDGRIVLRSGTTRRLSMDLDAFLLSWEKAGGWGLIVLNKGELPADLDLIRYLQAIAEIEATGNAVLAESGYRTVLRRFPQQPIALFGLANVLLAEKHFAEAARIYRDLLLREPANPAATNNLAEALAGLHCYRQALELLDDFLLKNGRQFDLAATLLATRGEIEARRQQAAEADSCHHQ